MKQIKPQVLDSFFMNYPFGSTKNVIVQADLADTKTTADLIDGQEPDSLYFRSLEKKGIQLNEPQLNAVRHYNGPSLVLAGAGSGKTRVLSSRAGYLITYYGIHPKNVLLVTFTRKAADEMKERIAQLPGLTNSMVRAITSGTYHSIFLQILRSQGDHRKIISNDKHKQTYCKIIMKQMGLQDDYEPESLLALLSYYKNNIVSLDEIPEETPPEKEIKEIFKQYEQMKAENGYMDFDDILLDSYFLLKSNHSLLQLIQSRFTHVLCDEWQDTNPLQYELIKMIAAPQNNLFVVGDDDQTIFEFNGADSSIILNFNKEFPETKTFYLDINYRSTTSIVGLANEIISRNSARYDKKLKATKQSETTPFFIRPATTEEEAVLIIKNIKNEVASGRRSFKDFAVLYRSNNNSRAIFEQFALNDIPFVSYSNTNTFYEQSILKPVIDHLRLSVDGENISAVSGILQTLYLNKDAATNFIQNRNLRIPRNNLLLHILDMENVRDFQKRQIRERIQLLQEMKEMSPLLAIKSIRKFYDKYLDADNRKHLTTHREMVNETLSELESSATRFKTIPQFLAFVEEIISKNQVMEDLRKNPHANIVKLMTIHKSKGLEFPVVFLIGSSENILPHSSSLEANHRKDLILKSGDDEKVELAIEGERRLAYVAVTRAEEELIISSPIEYRGEKVTISRFFLDVYTDQKTSVHGEKREKTRLNNPSKTKKIILAWNCTSASCYCWMRISSHEEVVTEHKSCPLCDSPMEKGKKEITE